MTEIDDSQRKRVAYDCLRESQTRELHSLTGADLLTHAKTVIESLAFLWVHDKATIEDLIHHVFPSLAEMPKMKIPKILTLLFATVETAGMPPAMQITLANAMIEWARKEKRNFVRQRLQQRYAHLLQRSGSFQECLDAVEPLIREGLKLDDKQLLTELYLLSSECYYAMHYFDKASGALMASRANSNGIYCEKGLQARLDFHSGLVALRSKDRSTAHSYFCEAFENFYKVEPLRAREALKLMLICRIETRANGPIAQVLARKHIDGEDSRIIAAVQQLADAYWQTDTDGFHATILEFADILTSDAFIAGILTDMYDCLINKRLALIIAPYSRIEIPYIAQVIKLEPGAVESRLSHMILDKKLNALIDQQTYCLVMKYDADEHTEKRDALETIQNLDELVSQLIQSIPT